VKAGAVRKLAQERTKAELEQGILAIVERDTDELGVEGDDLGEKLTHLMLAARIRQRMEDGEELQAAFRAEMAKVRTTLANE
jgi:hypothetical protein